MLEGINSHIIICDDIEDPEYSDKQKERLKEWYNKIKGLPDSPILSNKIFRNADRSEED